MNKIMQKNPKHLQAAQTVKSVFTPSPFVLFLKACNLRSHLVRSKIYPFKRTIGSCKCNTLRCQVGKSVKECMWLRKLLKSVIILAVIVRAWFIWYLVRCVVNNKYDQQQRGSAFDVIITSLANEKLREGRTACKGIFTSTF